MAGRAFGVALFAAGVGLQALDPAGACDANPTPYDVELADADPMSSTFTARLVGSEHGSFEISEMTGHPVLPIWQEPGSSTVANYEYATYDDGTFVGTGVKVTDVDPSSLGVHNWQQDLNALYHTDHSLERRRLMQGPSEDDYVFDEALGRRRLAGSTGTLNNLVVLVRFQDHATRCLPSRNDFDTLFNSDTAQAGIAPSGSVKMLYEENSYGQLTVNSVVTDWLTVSITEAAASGYEHTVSIIGAVSYTHLTLPTIYSV